MPSINTILRAVKDANSSLDHSEKEFKEHFGSGTIIRVKSDETPEGYTALVIAFPGHGYGLVNVFGEIASVLTCPSCNQDGKAVKGGIKGDGPDGDGLDEPGVDVQMVAEMASTSQIYDTLVELYSSLPAVDVLGTLSSVTESRQASPVG